ncbi:MAG TPA: hypothetical protein VG328_02840 [Stellaceae bacterium]|jgi:hypothetical protein|nr:hypothetical protein [Stellaceae bacterium]
MKLLFFSPHAALWVHAFPEALIAEALQDSGHEIVYVTCGSQLKAGCNVMIARGLSSETPLAERKQVCEDCAVQAGLLRRQFRLNGADLADELQPEDREEIGRLFADVTRDNFLDLTVHGAQVGRAALYEFLLDHKKSALTFAGDDEWRRYLVALKNTLYAAFAARRIMERENPDAVVTYNALYGINRAVCQVAAARGKPHYSLHASLNLAHRLQSMMVSKGDVFTLLRRAVAMWPALSQRPIDAAQAAMVTDHFLELLVGSSVFAYSAPRSGGTADPRSKLGIAPDKKVMCATLSSYDERFAAEAIGAREPVAGLLFPTQAEWVRALIDYVAARPELFLIIRVHPREFPNKREGVKSEHARQLEEEFHNLPPNAAINWPTDNLSLYDLAEITDVFLNAWSSVGKEMAMLGIPVVSYSENLPLYPVDERYLGTTSDSYFAAIARALADGWQFENIRRAYRWYNVEFETMVVDLADGFGKRERRSLGWAQDKMEKLLRLIDPYWEQKRDCWLRPKRLASRQQIARLFESGAISALDLAAPQATSAANETSALRSEIGRILHAMYPQGRGQESRLGRWLTQVSTATQPA